MKAEFIAIEITVIKINQKKYWPKTDPCGTPATELFLDEIWSLSICVVCVPLAKYDENHSYRIPLMP